MYGKHTSIPLNILLIHSNNSIFSRKPENSTRKNAKNVLALKRKIEILYSFRNDNIKLSFELGTCFLEINKPNVREANRTERPKTRQINRIDSDVRRSKIGFIRGHNPIRLLLTRIISNGKRCRMYRPTRARSSQHFNSFRDSSTFSQILFVFLNFSRKTESVLECETPLEKMCSPTSESEFAWANELRIANRPGFEKLGM